jgi:hypothetical protein
LTPKASFQRKNNIWSEVSAETTPAPAPYGISGSLQEWPIEQHRFEAAIDKLNSMGLIDPNKVGLMGWSRTGPHVGYFLTHSSYPIAAAVFGETADFGW